MPNINWGIIGPGNIANAFAHSIKYCEKSNLKEGTRGTKTDTNPGGEYSGIYEEDWEWTNSG